MRADKKIFASFCRLFFNVLESPQKCGQNSGHFFIFHIIQNFAAKSL